MKQISCVIFVEPTAKGRPRSTVVAGHVHTYTPKRTRVAEADIKAAIRQEIMKAGSFDAGVPLRISATFFRERPKSLPKRSIYPVSKPDLDNYFKTLTDALEKYVYPNDSQIVSCTTQKRYCLPGQVPRIELTIIEEVE